MIRAVPQISTAIKPPPDTSKNSFPGKFLPSLADTFDSVRKGARLVMSYHAGGRLGVFEYLEGWYNPHRRHSALGQQSRANYERYHLSKDVNPNGKLSVKPG